MNAQHKRDVEAPFSQFKSKRCALIPCVHGCDLDDEKWFQKLEGAAPGHERLALRALRLMRDPAEAQIAAAVHIALDTGLVFACSVGNADLAHMFLQRGARVDAYSHAPLQYAVRSDAHLHLCDLLLQHGADPDACGGAALMHAARFNCPDMVKALHAVSKQTSSGVRALRWARLCDADLVVPLLAPLLWAQEEDAVCVACSNGSMGLLQTLYHVGGVSPAAIARCIVIARKMGFSAMVAWLKAVQECSTVPAAPQQMSGGAGLDGLE